MQLMIRSIGLIPVIIFIFLFTFRMDDDDDDERHGEDREILGTLNSTAVNLTHVLNATTTNAVCDDSNNATSTKVVCGSSEYTMANMTMFTRFSELLLGEMFEA